MSNETPAAIDPDMFAAVFRRGISAARLARSSCMLKRNGKVANRDDQLSLFDFARRGGSKQIYLTQYGLMAERHWREFRPKMVLDFS